MSGRIGLPADVYAAWVEAFEYLEELARGSDLSISAYCRDRSPSLNLARFKMRLKTLNDYYGTPICTGYDDKSAHPMLTDAGPAILDRVRSGFELVERRAREPVRVRIAAIGYVAVAKVSAALARAYGREKEPPEIELKPYRSTEEAMQALGRNEVSAVFLVRNEFVSEAHGGATKFVPLGERVGPVLLHASGKTPPLESARWVVPRPHIEAWERLLPQGPRIVVPTNFEVVELVRQGVGCAIFPDVFEKGKCVGVTADGLAWRAWSRNAPDFQFGAFLAGHYEHHVSEGERAFVDGMFDILGRHH